MTTSLPEGAWLSAGTRFGSYVAVRPLAAGGMAELYLAFCDDDERSELVAVKRMLPHLGWEPEFIRMFLDEVRIAASLDHPNIVQVLDFGVSEAGHYLAMEYLHGWSLGEILRAGAKDSASLPLGACVGLVLEIAAGLDAVHEHRDAQGQPLALVHRDVSPSNVMITTDGEVKLLDFGIAKVSARTQLTRAGTLKGKIGYMSPEQCRGTRIDRRSDVFCLGILLYELTVGRRAFFAPNDYATMGKTVDGDYVRPSAHRPGYPKALEAIVTRAMAVRVEDRYPSARALADELREFAQRAHLDVSLASRRDLLLARIMPPPWPRYDRRSLRQHASRQAGRRRWPVLGGVAAAVLIGFGFGVWATRSGTDDPSPETSETPETSGPRATGRSGAATEPSPIAPTPRVEPSADPEPREVPSAGGSSTGEPVEATTAKAPDSRAANGAGEGETRGGPRRRARRRRGPAKAHKRRVPEGDPGLLLPVR